MVIFVFPVFVKKEHRIMQVTRFLGFFAQPRSVHLCDIKKEVSVCLMDVG